MNYVRCVLFLLFCSAPLVAEVSSLIVGGGYTFLQQGNASGNLGTFQASYIYQPVRKFYSGITLKLEEGSIHSSQRRKRILDIDTQERVGYTFGSLDRKWVLSLFTGLGYRYLKQKEKWLDVAFSSSHNDLYVPVGLFVDGELSPRLRLGLSGQWRPQVYPALTISSRHGMRWITERTWGNFLAEVPLAMKVSSDYPIYLVFNPFVDFWQEGHTQADFGLGLPLPEQTFLFIGINANLSLGF